MMWTEDVARELIADRLRTLQAAYSPDPRPTASRRTRRWWRFVTHRPNRAARTRLAAGHG